MIEKNCIKCQKRLMGKSEVCDNCKTEVINDIDDITKLSGAIEALALLKSIKESTK